MRIILKFILINVSEKKIRTSLVIFSIMVSAALLFASISISDIISKMLIENARQPCGSSEIIVASNQYSPSHFFTMTKLDNYKKRMEYAIGAIQASAAYKWKDNMTVNVSVLAMDLADVEKMNPITLVTPSRLDEVNNNGIIISKPAAEKYNLSVGSVIDLSVEGTDMKFSVVGIAQPTGFFANESPGINVIASRYTISAIFDAKGQASIVFIKLVNPTEKNDMIDELSNVYKKYDVKEPITEEELTSHLGRVTSAFMLLTIIVFLIGAFIIYSSFKVVTMERLPVIGTLRSVGATKGATKMMLFAESSAYGVIGGLLGCGLGVLILYAMAVTSRPEGYVGNIEVIIKPVNMLIAFIVAVVLCIASSMFPILKVSKIPIKDIILNSVENVRQKKKLKFMLILAVFAIAVVVSNFAPYQVVMPVNVICFIVSVVCTAMLVPYLTNAFIKVFEKLYTYIFRNEGIIAAKNLRNNRNIFNNITLLAIGISTLLVIYSLCFSVVKGLDSIYSTHKFDIWLWYDYADRDFATRLSTVDGVASVYCDYQEQSVEVAGKNSQISKIEGIDTNNYLKFWDVKFEGNSAELLNELNEGRNIILSTTLEKRFGVEKGDTLTLRFSDGKRDYKVIGFMLTPMYTGDFALVADKYLKWDTERQYFTNVLIKTSKDPAETEEQLYQKLSNISFASTTLKDYKQQDVESNVSVFNIINGFALLAVIIGVFSVLNNNIISFIERRRSFTVFRSIGMNKRQMVKMIFVETLTSGIMGGVIGISSAFILLFNINGILNALSLPVALRLSAIHFAISFFGGIFITLTASISSALKSSKMNIIETLKYE